MVSLVLKLIDYFSNNDLGFDILINEIENKYDQYTNLPFKEINCSDQYIPIFDINTNFINTWTKGWDYSNLNDIPFTTSKYVNCQQVLENLNISQIDFSCSFLEKKDINETLDLNSTIIIENENYFKERKNLNDSDVDYSFVSILDKF